MKVLQCHKCFIGFSRSSAIINAEDGSLICPNCNQIGNDFLELETPTVNTNVDSLELEKAIENYLTAVSTNELNEEHLHEVFSQCLNAYCGSDVWDWINQNT